MIDFTYFNFPLEPWPTAHAEHQNETIKGHAYNIFVHYNVDKAIHGLNCFACGHVALHRTGKLGSGLNLKARITA